MLAIDEAKAELFYSTCAENQLTQKFCVTVAVEAAGCVILGCKSSMKILHEYISDHDGRHSYKIALEGKKEAGLNLHTNNNASKQQLELS